jgi:hypothetical protein
MFLVTGAGKQEAVDNWRKGVAIPATLIHSQWRGCVLFWCCIALKIGKWVY